MDQIENFKLPNWCGSYNKNIELRKKGLCEEAFKVLDQFFIDYVNQNKQSRREIVVIVNEIADFYNNGNLYLPINLHRKIIEPEIHDWIKEEPMNPIPLIWTREINFLLRALHIESNNQIALNKAANAIINKISYNQHEIEAGYGYLGNPIEDIELIDSFLKFIANIVDEEKKDYYSKELEVLKMDAILSL